MQYSKFKTWFKIETSLLSQAEIYYKLIVLSFPLNVSVSPPACRFRVLTFSQLDQEEKIGVSQGSFLPGGVQSWHLTLCFKQETKLTPCSRVSLVTI